MGLSEPLGFVVGPHNYLQENNLVTLLVQVRNQKGAESIIEIIAIIIYKQTKLKLH